MRYLPFGLLTPLFNTVISTHTTFRGRELSFTFLTIYSWKYSAILFLDKISLNLGAIFSINGNNCYITRVPIQILTGQPLNYIYWRNIQLSQEVIVMYFSVYKSYACFIFICVCITLFNLKKPMNFMGIGAWQVLKGEKGRWAIR